jgi:hypothetical protein
MDPLIPHKHIDRKLLIRLLIFLGIATAMAGFVIYDVVKEELSWWLALLGVLIGIAVGYVLGRVLTVKWHEGRRKAVMEMDVVGFVAIGFYILFRFGGNFVLSEWLSGAALSTLSLAILAGALFGRFLGLRTSVAKLIEENV